MRPVSANLFRESQKLVSEGAFIWLLRFADPEEATVFRLTNNRDHVTFDGDVYEAYPFKVSSYEEDGTGQLSTLSISLTNVTRDVSRALENNVAILDGEAILTLVNLNHMTKADALEWRFYIKSATVSEKSASLELNSTILFDHRFPLRKFRRNCPYAYKGDECQYIGDLPTCDHTLFGTNGCIAHGLDELANALPNTHPHRFGGFPGILKS